MITANVWERVVRVVCGPWAGTGFTIDHKGNQYLVTARHVIETSDPVEVSLRGSPMNVGLTPLIVPVAEADVAVFRTDGPLTPDLPLPPTSDLMTFGQDAYFLGYPHGLTFDIGGGAYFPLVKRATISGNNHEIHNRPVLLLDGWNNPGFSGGPVVFRPYTGLGIHEPLRVCGVVVSNWPEAGDVTIQGGRVQGIETVLNSGVIIAEQIARVVEAIDSAAS